MDRKQQLLKIVCKDGAENKDIYIPLIEKVIFIEEKLKELEGLPFYKVNPSNQLQQKMLPAFKLYKELLQQYTNCIKVLSSAGASDESGEESPLRKWVKSRMGGE